MGFGLSNAINYFNRQIEVANDGKRKTEINFHSAVPCSGIDLYLFAVLK